MKSRGLSIVLAGLFTAAALAADAPRTATIHYSFDEADGQTVHDSGGAKADATLSTASESGVEDAGFTTGPAGQWQPILRNGVQIKNIKAGSDHLLLDTDAPSVFDRNTDYAIDYSKGLVKPLPGGRMSAGQRVSVGLAYTNTGPTRVPGHAGKALKFNGKDAFVDCGDPQGLAAVSEVTLDVWFNLPEDWNRDGLLLCKGEGLSLGFDKGRLVFCHAGLNEKATTAPASVEISTGAWHHLTASYSKGATVVKLDDKEIARTEKLSGRIESDGPLRIGGTIDPRFYNGLIDDVDIKFTPAGDK